MVAVLGRVCSSFSDLVVDWGLAWSVIPGCPIRDFSQHEMIGVCGEGETGVRVGRVVVGWGGWGKGG